MQYPKMILFDYGQTLLGERDFDPVRGNAELLRYAVKNPHGCTLEDVRRAVDVVYGQHAGAVRTLGYEIPAQIVDRTLYAWLGIEFSLTPLEMEMVFWDAAAPAVVMPGADEMLRALQARGIRTGVISNLAWSGAALTQRLQRLLPENQFEFVLTSSDYFLRKPNRLLFEIALQKSELSAQDVWFCGDNPQADVEGAAAAGLFPVWYTPAAAGRDVPQTMPQCAHLRIQSWDALLEALDRATR